mgnify:CR=1 FL=1
MISILSAAKEMDKPVLTFVQPETVETKVLYNVLSALRIEDVELSYEDGTLVAKDENNLYFKKNPETLRGLMSHFSKIAI